MSIEGHQHNKQMNITENSNWIKARAACSVANVFQELASAVEGDIVERNAQRKDGEIAEFRFNRMPRGFSVVRDGPADSKSVEFWCDELQVVVTGALGTGVKDIRATLALNRDGQCRFVVNGDQLAGWEFRMRALDTLFFGIA